MAQQNSATTSTTSPSSYLLKIAEKKKNIQKKKNLLALFPNSASYLAFHHPTMQTSIQCYSSLHHP